MKYADLIALLEDSPLPWTSSMLADWFECAGCEVVRCASQGHIASVGWGLYTAKDRVPLRPPSHAPYRTATLSPRGPEDTITDDMLAKYGFNL